jgi:hypothetical protein
MRSGMQHRHRRAPLRRVGLLASALASGFGAAGCDGTDRVMLAPPEAAGGAPTTDPAGAIEPDPESPPIAGFSVVGTCSMELPACESGSSVACTLRCGARPNGCVAYAEFVPLGTNQDEAYSLLWGPIDPEGRWAFYRRELSRGRRETTLYGWSVEEGDVALADALSLPAANPEVHEALRIIEVGAAGGAILLLGFDDEVANHGYVWAREAGLTRLDFLPWDMSADGRVVVGARDGRAVVWERDAGARRLDGAALDAPTPIVPEELARLTSVRWIRVSDSGERVLSVENSGRGFRWSEALGVVPLEGLLGFPQDASVELADLESGAIVASRARSEREPLRLWWWDDAAGALELGTLPDQQSSYRRSASMLRAGGDVIIGDEASSFGDVSVFRWTAELGTERASPPSTLSLPLYVNPEGTTIVGTASVGVQTDTFRWTARGGVSVIPEGGGTSLIALGGDVLVTPDGDDPARRLVSKFDQTLEMGEPLPIDLIAAGLVADRDAVVSVDLVSENARLLAGTLRDSRGVSRAWILRLRDTCDPS